MEVGSAHYNMIEQQIRPWDVMSPEVLEAFAEIDRADFVKEEHHNLAYVDMQLPIESGQRMLEPRVEARILQALAIAKSDSVFEVGTGSGFMTALFSRLAKRVTSAEISSELHELAQTRLQDYPNISLLKTDALSEEFTPSKSYHVIVLTGTVKTIPENLLYALREGGRMVAFVEDEPGVTSAVLMHRIAARNWHEEKLFELSVPALETQSAELTSFTF